MALVENKEKLFARYSLVCDNCGGKETDEEFQTPEEVAHFHFDYKETQKRGHRLTWAGDLTRCFCPFCRVDGW